MSVPNRALGLRTSAALAGAPYWQMLRGVAAPILTPKVHCINISLATAVETDLILVKSLTLGTPSAVHLSNRLTYLGPGDVLNTRFATSWSVAPTITDQYEALSRVQLPANVGGAVTWEFEDGCLELQNGESLLLWNIGAVPGAVLDVTCFFEGT